MSVERGRERGRVTSLRSMLMQRGLEEVRMWGMRRMMMSSVGGGGRGGLRRIWEKTTEERKK